MIDVLRAVRKALLTHAMRSSASVVLLTTMAATSITVVADNRAPAEFSIPASSLEDALSKFGAQSGMQVAYGPELARGLKAPAVSGRFIPDVALDKLLQGTGLTWSYVNETTVVLKRAATSKSTERVAAPNRVDNDEVAEEVIVKGIPEVMVLGKKSLNVDIERTEDDPQPYVVFDRELIEKSGASNLNDFLLTRLPMNSSATPMRQLTPENGGMSGINLRGLGANQTLILIDGRRAAQTSKGGLAGQTDINGIPLEAIERIEILPTTASAIYGGSATGGVINVIMRRDYVGTRAAVTYDNSFDSDSALKRIDLSSGFNLFEGKTNILLTGSYTESNPLRIKDRDFIQRARERILANNPAYLSSPPLSNGVNIRSANGTNLVLDDGRALGSAFTSVPASYGGFASDSGAALLSNAGTYNTEPGNTTSVRSGAGGNTAITGGGPAATYVGGSLRHEFTEKIKGFVEVSRSENNVHFNGRGVGLPAVTIAANAPGNPFQQAISVAASTQQLANHSEANSEYDRYGAGLIFSLPAQWTASADYTWSKSKYSRSSELPDFGTGASFLAAVAAGTIDVLRDFDQQGLDVTQFLVSDFSYRQTPLEVTTRNPAIRFSGPLGSLPAGQPRVSVLLERQDSTFGDSIFFRNGSSANTYYPKRSQTVDSAYLELLVPVLSRQSEISWINELELQLAGRWDSYQSDNAPSVSFAPNTSPAAPPYTHSESERFSPLVALRFQPRGGVTIRGSYGKGFLPPDITQLTAATLTPNVDMSTAIDPRRGNTTIPGLIEHISGGNPDLGPETSTTWSAGFIFTPSWLEDLRLSVDYTQIDKEGNIQTLSVAQLLADEASFPGRVTRGANLPGDQAGWAGPITSIDTSHINAARTELAAYDVQLDYTLRTAAHGAFSVFATATWQTKFEFQTNPSAALVDNLGWTTIGAQQTPLDLRGNLGLEWSTRQWTLGWTARYTSSYYVANPALVASMAILRAQGNGGRVPAQTYHDIFGRYRFGRVQEGGGLVGGLLDGMEVRAGVRNVFNTKPPVDLSSFYYLHSGLGDPRLASYYITLRKSF